MLLKNLKTFCAPFFSFTIYSLGFEHNAASSKRSFLIIPNLVNDSFPLNLHENHTSFSSGTYHIVFYECVITLFYHMFLENKNHLVLIFAHQHGPDSRSSCPRPDHVSELPCVRGRKRSLLQ